MRVRERVRVRMRVRMRMRVRVRVRVRARVWVRVSLAGGVLERDDDELVVAVLRPLADEVGDARDVDL